MKKFPIILVALFTAVISFYPSESYVYSDKPAQDSVVVVTIAATGDLMCHSVQYNYARTNNGDYNFNPFFDEVREHLSAADFTFGNLETVTAGREKAFSGYPFFNSPDEYLDALKNAGFDLLTTANNHSLDKGEPGLRRTIDQLVSRGINYNGTFLSERDRDSVRNININGIRIAFLAYTYGTNGIPIPKNKPYLINIIDTVKIREDISIARSAGCDIVLLHFHFGSEYERLPDKYQRDVVKASISAGADIIIGGHPHVIQPLEYFQTYQGSIDTGIAAYSLGNFFSNQRWRYSDAGVILYITLEKNLNTGRVRLVETEYLPTWVYRAGGKFSILPSENYESYSFLTDAEKNKLQQSFYDTREIISKFTSRAKLKSTVNEGILHNTTP